MLFASDDAPLRCSYLPQLLRCALSLRIKLADSDTAGPAADTGSAVHMAARVFHTKTKDPSACVIAMRAMVEQYPFAKLDDAEEQFRLYAADKRNQEADVILCEETVRFSLPPAESDPTQAPIVITGTLDQVRKGRNGLYTVWDIKTGSPEGVDMLNVACVQLAAYQWAATQHLGFSVRGAGVIRTKDYLKRDRSRKPKPGPVFYEAPWSYADLASLLYGVRLRVAEVRRGELYPAPGEEACKWCVGLASCTTRIKDFTDEQQSTYRLHSLSLAPGHVARQDR